MPLLGTLSTMPLPDLLQWLGTARQSGTLAIEKNKVVKSILFREGRVIGCSSDDPPEKLGQFLLSRGKISEDQLRQALSTQESTRKHLGMILVGMSAISEEDLTVHLSDKAEETIYSVFDWDDAVFRFEESVSDVRNVLPISLQVEDILLRGLKRFDEMRLIRSVFNDPGIVLAQTPRMPPPEVFNNKMARRIYEAVNGERAVAEILLVAHGSEYLVTKFLYELHRNGFVKITGVREIATAQSSTGTDAAPPADLAPREQPDRPAGSRPLQDLPRAAAAPGAPFTLELPVPGAAANSPAAAVATPPVEPMPPAQEPAAAPERGSVVSDDEAASSGRPQGVDAEIAAARDLMSRGELDTALQLLDRAYGRNPQNESVRQLAARAEKAFVEKAYRHYVPADSVPFVVRPIEELETESISPTEFYLLSRIDGTWDVKSIIQVTPLREVEALLTLKRMREAGIIDFRNPKT